MYSIVVKQTDTERTDKFDSYREYRNTLDRYRSGANCMKHLGDRVDIFEVSENKTIFFINCYNGIDK